MKNNFIVLISAIVLSLSLIFSAVYVSNGIQKNSLMVLNNSITTQSLLMNSDQAAEYMGISVDTLVSNIKRERIEKYSLTSYEPYRFIPYLNIDGVMYFTKSDLANWAAYQTINH